MLNNIRNWLHNNINEYEVTPAYNNEVIIFIPAVYDGKARKYFKRYNIKWEYRANYTWIAFFVPQEKAIRN